MTIKIPDKNIMYTLTEDELWAAYEEQRHLNDIADIDAVSGLYEEDDSPEWEWLRGIMEDDKKINKLARLKAEYESDYRSVSDAAWIRAVETAVEDMYYHESKKGQV